MFFLHTINQAVVEAQNFDYEPDTETYYEDSVGSFRSLNADSIESEGSLWDGWDSGFCRTTFVMKDGTYHGFVRFDLS